MKVAIFVVCDKKRLLVKNEKYGTLSINVFTPPAYLCDMWELVMTAEFCVACV